MRHRAATTATMMLISWSVALAQEMPEATPLFDSHEPLVITIQAPLATIFDDRSQESSEHPGLLSYVNSQGDFVQLNINIKTRGKTRLDPDVCEFPPLRLDFSSDELGGTLFAGQDGLKLVTHCEDGRSEYEQYVLQEYLIYRSYNLLTDMSLRVRLAHITYHDTDGDRDPVTRYAFLIENEDRMADRLGWEVIETHGIPPDAVDPEQLSLLEVFQFLIGNTDWSAFAKEPEKTACCHNTTPIGHPAGPVFSVPYDFDMSGLLSTRYANRLYRGNLDRLMLRSVRDRRYQGRCKSQPHLRDTFRLFNENREAIFGLFENQEGLDAETREDAVEYLEDFYEIIDDERRVNRDIVRRCRNF